MTRILEAWMYGDPADAVERIELQANHRAAKETDKAIEKAKIQSKRERMRERVFKKAGAK